MASGTPIPLEWVHRPRTKQGRPRKGCARSNRQGTTNRTKRECRRPHLASIDHRRWAATPASGSGTVVLADNRSFGFRQLAGHAALTSFNAVTPCLTLGEAAPPLPSPSSRPVKAVPEVQNPMPRPSWGRHHHYTHGEAGRRHKRNGKSNTGPSGVVALCQRGWRGRGRGRGGTDLTGAVSAASWTGGYRTSSGPALGWCCSPGNSRNAVRFVKWELYTTVPACDVHLRRRRARDLQAGPTAPNPPTPNRPPPPPPPPPPPGDVINYDWGPGMYNGGEGGSERGRGVWLGPPSSLGLQKFFTLKSSWHQRHRSRNFGCQPYTLEGEEGGGRGSRGGGGTVPPPAVYCRSNTSVGGGGGAGCQIGAMMSGLENDQHSPDLMRDSRSATLCHVTQSQCRWPCRSRSANRACTECCLGATAVTGLSNGTLGGFWQEAMVLCSRRSWRRPLADRHSLPFPSLSFSEGPPSRCFGPPFPFLHRWRVASTKTLRIHTGKPVTSTRSRSCTGGGGGHWVLPSRNKRKLWNEQEKAHGRMVSGGQWMPLFSHHRSTLDIRKYVAEGGACTCDHFTFFTHRPPPPSADQSVFVHEPLSCAVWHRWHILRRSVASTTEFGTTKRSVSLWIREKQVHGRFVVWLTGACGGGGGAGGGRTTRRITRSPPPRPRPPRPPPRDTDVAKPSRCRAQESLNSQNTTLFGDIAMGAVPCDIEGP